jgi:hypothetical protein
MSRCVRTCNTSSCYNFFTPTRIHSHSHIRSKLYSQSHNFCFCVPYFKTWHYAKTSHTFYRNIPTFYLFIQLTDAASTHFTFGQWVDRFTSRRTSWFSDELGRPLGVPRAPVFSSRESTIRSRTSCSLNFRCDIVLPHDLFTMYALRIVRSNRWKNN